MFIRKNVRQNSRSKFKIISFTIMGNNIPDKKKEQTSRVTPSICNLL